MPALDKCINYAILNELIFLTNGFANSSDSVMFAKADG